MGFNIGGFMGGLSQGINQGLQIRKIYQDEKNKSAIDEARQKGMADAEAARQADIENSIKTVSVADDGGLSDAIKQGITPVSVSNGAQNPNDPVTNTTTKYGFAGQNYDTQEQAQSARDSAKLRLSNPNDPVSKTKTMYMYGDKQYATPDEAKAEATKAAKDSSYYFMKNAVPQIRDMYIAQGDLEKATAFDKWANDKKSQDAIKQWSTGYVAAKSGDWDSAASSFGKYYTDYVNDGVDYVGHKIIMGEDGQPSKILVSLKQQGKDGKAFDMELTPQSMLEMGASNNPKTLFETEAAKQAAAEKAKLDIAVKRAENADKEAIDARKDKRQFGYDVSKEKLRGNIDIAKENNQSNNRIQEAGIKANIDAAAPGTVAKQISDMRNSGLFTDEEIKNATMAKASTTGKSLDFTHARLNAFQKLADPNNFAKYGKDQKQWKDLSKEEQSKVLDETANMIIKQPASSGISTVPTPSGNVPIWRGQ